MSCLCRLQAGTAEGVVCVLQEELGEGGESGTTRWQRGRAVSLSSRRGNFCQSLPILMISASAVIKNVLRDSSTHDDSFPLRICKLFIVLESQVFF